MKAVFAARDSPETKPPKLVAISLICAYYITMRHELKEMNSNITVYPPCIRCGLSICEGAAPSPHNMAIHTEYSQLHRQK